MKTERRSNKRLNEQIGAMFENEACQVLNISERGVLLQLNHPTMFLGIEKCIDFDLQLDGQWIRLRGKVEWIHDELALSRLGLSVQDAPSLYFDFLRKRLE
ncbi:MAG: PilZ domain-containing protein [Candidatus Omnitrophota bacterium]